LRNKNSSEMSPSANKTKEELTRLTEMVRCAG
jgi:hypothetical protein